MVVKLTRYDASKAATTRHNALKKEVAEHGLAEVIFAIRQKMAISYTRYGCMKRDIKWMVENLHE